jgi:hypothetical protein
LNLGLGLGLSIVIGLGPKIDESMRGSNWKRGREREEVERKMKPII